jgi:REP element-mobilizing transposase RayT
MGRRERQQELPFRTWGGKRRGAGRKPGPGRAKVPHRARERLTRHAPAHVTLRVLESIPNLRRRRPLGLLWGVFQAARERLGGRLIHYSVQTNHLHLVVEAEDEKALARFMAGLKIRMARALNRTMERTGRVFAERYHARVLRSPSQTRRALCYVLNNDLRHGRGRATAGFDYCSSAVYFDGWRDGPVRWPRDNGGPAPCVEARAWLLTTGWRKVGLIGLDEVPGPAP